jgi:hypothetical protein
VSPLTQRHRAQQLLLRRATQSQAARLWPVLDYAQLDESFPALAASTARLVQANGQTSAGLAAGYLREFRRNQRVAGAAKIVLSNPLDADQFATSLRVTSVIAVKKATANGVAPDVAMANAKTETLGALARLVLNAGRSTITGSLAADPRAAGYQRVLGGSGCDFCQMLAGRGEVYSAESADFEAHDHCGCTAEPVYRA